MKGLYFETGREGFEVISDPMPVRCGEHKDEIMVVTRRLHDNACFITNVKDISRLDANNPRRTW